MKTALIKKLYAKGGVRIKYDITCDIQDKRVHFANTGIMQLNSSGVIRITGGDGFITYYQPKSLEDAVAWLGRFTYIAEYNEAVQMRA